MLGKAIGRYVILSELGRGANGVVWKARHALLPDRLVALKVLSEELWSSKQARDRFLREAIAVSRLDHPGIATLYDAEEVDGQLYIAFKLIEGGTVAHRTTQGPLPLREAVAIGRDAAEALAHAHAQGVIHRDLSPGNIMVNREGHGVLVDFGLARAGEQSATATTGVVIGTLAYMPPEILRAEAADARSDIYSLGAVLYRMITGRAPFDGDRAEEIVFKILSIRPVPPSTLNSATPTELDDIVLRALERNPQDRYAGAGEMARALNEVLERPALRDGAIERGSIGSRLISRVRRALRRRPSSRGLVWSGVACAVLAWLAIGWTQGWVPVFTSRKPVVAVLPTRNLSEDPSESAYLSGAFGEALVTRLGQSSSVRMLPWLTTQRFADPKQPLEAVGRELHADKLVASSYRSDGEQVQVTVVLVDARTGLQIWSQAYEESVEDVIALQQGVALGIASHMGGKLTSTERGRLGAAASRSPEAYEYYLRGANLLQEGVPQSVALAGPLFERALNLDPNLAEAWVGVGALNTDLYFRGQGGLGELAAAEKAFRRALSLEPRLDSAVRGLIRVAYERGQWEEVLRIGKGQTGRGDDPGALQARAWAYVLGGLPDKAIPLFDRILELDPASQAAAWYRVVAESWAGESTLATNHAKAYLRKFGEDPEVYTWLATSRYVEGDKEQARSFITRATELFGEDQSNLYSALFAITIYRDLGENSRADSLSRHWLDILDARFRANPNNGRVRTFRAWLSASLGVPGSDQQIDALLADRVNGVPGSQAVLLVVSGIRDIPRLRLALRRLGGVDLAGDYPVLRDGSVQLLFGHQWPVVQRLPEYLAVRDGIQRRHDYLAARY